MIYPYSLGRASCHYFCSVVGSKKYRHQDETRVAVGRSAVVSKCRAILSAVDDQGKNRAPIHWFDARRRRSLERFVNGI